MQIGRADGAVVGSRTSSLLLTVGYTFRSRSPRPGRPAVPHHAACRGCSHQYRRSRLRLPPSPPRRYDDEAMDGLSPPYGHQRLVAHWNRSHAKIAWACARRNCAQVGPARRGAGSIPAVFRIFQTVEAPIVGDHVIPQGCDQVIPQVWSVVDSLAGGRGGRGDGAPGSVAEVRLI